MKKTALLILLCLCLLETPVVDGQEYECNLDADCQDRLWCTGTETCINHWCNEGAPPCDDDDECSIDKCREAHPHCGSNMNCEQVEGICNHYCFLSPVSPCMEYPICYSFGCYTYPDNHYDYDCDSVEDDGDGSGTKGDHPCVTRQTVNCDDNCRMDQNSTQDDAVDGDGFGYVCDNCPHTPNGPYGGTCTKGSVGIFCLSDSGCGAGGVCSMNQEDNDHDGWGDVCDPDDDNDAITDSGDNCPIDPNPIQEDADSDEKGDICDNCPNTPNPNQEDSYPPQGNSCGDACDCKGNFEPDGDVDGSDAIKFKLDFGRKPPTNPCTSSNPCNGDFDCDGNVDGSDAVLFKRDFGRRDCPTCASGEWCSYQ